MMKDGKLFGKINIFDMAILLLIIALMIAGVSKFRTFNKTVDNEAPGKLLYTVIINSVRDYTANAFVSGDVVYDKATDIDIGVIKNVEITNSKAPKNLENGTTKIIENPYKRDVILTIETPATVTNNGYFANKSIELKVGSEKNIETRYASILGRIGSIVYSEGD